MNLEDEILISAYLDGETSGDERQRVEQLLAASAEARQLADELRAVRTRLQELPRYGLPTDFAGKVLHKAGAELAQASTAAAAQAKTSGAVVAPQPEFPSVWKTWRGYTWAAVAVAAALMIWLGNRETADQPVAMANRDALSDDHTSRIAASGEEQRSNSAGSLATAKADRRSGEGAAMEPAVVKSAPAESSFGEGQSLEPSSAKTGFAPPSGAVDGRVAAGKSADVDAQGNQTTPSIKEIVESHTNGVLVVRLDITADAAEQREFDRLLAKNRILLGDQSQVEKDAEKQSSDTLDKSVKTDRLDVAAEGTRARQDSLQQKPLASWVPEVEPVGNLEVVYVEASPEQLTATIDELVSSHQWFSSVAVAQTLPISKLNIAQMKKESAGLTAAATTARSQELVDDENNRATELMTSDRSKDAKPNEGKQPADHRDRDFGVAQSMGRATRMALPAETKSDASASASTLTNTPVPTGEPNASAFSGLDRKKAESESNAKSKQLTGIKQTSAQRAIFVLRLVEPAPVAETPK